MSDTDFRQFEQYGGMTGLDIALVKDSYKYHTRLDTVEYIEPGAMQHFGENTLAILKYLASEATAADLRGIKKAKEILYFTILGGKIFVMMKANQVTILYGIMLLLSLVIAHQRLRWDRLTGYIVCFLSIPLSIVSGLVSANLVALLMTQVLDKPLAYFRKEWWCLLLYGVPAVLGAWGIRNCGAAVHFSPTFTDLNGPTRHRHLPVFDGTAYRCPKLLQAWGGLAAACSLAFLPLVHVCCNLFGTFHGSSVSISTRLWRRAILLQLTDDHSGRRSCYATGTAAFSLLLTLIVNDYVLTRGSESPSRRGVSTLSYLIGQTIPLLTGAEGMIAFLDVIIPLTGRMGIEAPADHITATLGKQLGASYSFRGLGSASC